MWCGVQFHNFEPRSRTLHDLSSINLLLLGMIRRVVSNDERIPLRDPQPSDPLISTQWKSDPHSLYPSDLSGSAATFIFVYLIDSLDEDARFPANQI